MLFWMFVSGLLAAIEALTLYSAFNLEKASYAMSIKRTAPIFALLMGYYWFGEQLNFKKITAITCMIAGAVIIGLFQ